MEPVSLIPFFRVDMKRMDEMDNNTNPEKDSIYIYHSEESKYKQINITDSLPSDDIELSIPFHLSKSNLYRCNTGFCLDKYGNRTAGEVIEYSPVKSLIDFRSTVQKDVAPCLYIDHLRGSNRVIESDVLVFDIDNHSPKRPELFEDESIHLTIEKFTEMFKEYEFLISTSVSHQIQKTEKQAPRDKYHCFMALGKKITDEKECNELLEKLDYYIKSKTHDYESIEKGSDDDYSLMDMSVKSTYQIWGNENTIVYYNKGGSINDLLYKEDFLNNYRGYKRDSGQQRNRRHQENPTISGNYELNQGGLLEDWDYVNIISRVGLHGFYKINRSVGDGYFMGFCDHHPDNKTSLQIFPNGGYNCMACGSKGISALEYEAKKTGIRSGQVRKKYCKELGLDHNHFLMWLNNKKPQKSIQEEEPNGMASEWQEQVDQPHENDLEGQLKLQQPSGQEKVNEGRGGDSSDDTDEPEDPYQYPITSTNDVFVSEEVYRELEELNKTQAIVNFEGKTVCPQYKTGRGKWKEIVYDRKISDMTTYLEDEKRPVKKIVKGGKEEYSTQKLGDMWRYWDKRRKYDVIDFYPDDEKRNPLFEGVPEVFDVYDDWDSANVENDWKGDMSKRGLTKFLNQDRLNTITPDTELMDLYDGCNLYLDHIYNIICGNYEGQRRRDLSNYIIGWMSKALTHHTEGKVTVAIVLRGGKGSGKGTVQKIFGELFGRHYLHLLSLERFTGRFNIQLLDKLFVFIDEVMFEGDKKIENLLNGLITEDTFTVEAKYINPYTAPNFQHYMFASNQQWVVPGSWDDRRYMVIDISERFSGGLGKKEYFDPLYDQMNNGGKEHLYKFLTHPRIMDMADEIDYQEDRPVTMASIEQKFEGDSVGKWFYGILKSGGHYYTDSLTNQSKFCDWNQMEQNGFINFYKDKVGLHESYLKFMDEEYPQEIVSKGIGVLTNGLNKLNQRGLITFSTPRSDPKKHGDSQSYRFGSLARLRRLFVDQVFDGDEILAWGEEIEDDDLAPPVQRNLHQMFEQSRKRMEQRFSETEKEDDGVL